MKNRTNLRIYSVYFFFILLFLLLVLRIGYLQIFHDDFFKKLSSRQSYLLLPFEGDRGNIYDVRGRLLATNMNVYSVFVDPKMVEDKRKVIGALSETLDLDKSMIEKKIDSPSRFVWIKRKVSLAKIEKLKSLNLKGVGFIREKKRFYPQGKIAGHLLGGVNIDNRGIEGVEVAYNRFLEGKKGVMRGFCDATSSGIINSLSFLYPHKGADLVLTVDAQIQYWAEDYLRQTIEKYKARRGSIVVMEPNTGEILALANFPYLDPNRLSSTSFEERRNYAITDIFEPGSVFKIVTLVAAISQGVDKKIDKIFCEEGKWKIPGSILHDWKPYGELTFEEVFKKSSNIGVAKIATQFLNKNILYEYIKKLGFGRKTGIDLLGEAKGLVEEPSQWSKTSEYIVPIGQGIGVTLIQLVKAMSIIVNGGFEITPHVVKKVVSQNFLWENKIKRKKVLPAWVAERAQEVLVKVVNEGTGKLARIPNVCVGGKTGTAQKFDPKLGRYSPTDYRATFVGFIKEEDISLVIGVSVDEPRVSHFGGVVAAPVFKNVGVKVLDYLRLNMAKYN